MQYSPEQREKKGVSCSAKSLCPSEVGACAALSCCEALETFCILIKLQVPVQMVVESGDFEQEII